MTEANNAQAEGTLTPDFLRFRIALHMLAGNGYLNIGESATGGIEKEAALADAEKQYLEALTYAMALNQLPGNSEDLEAQAGVWNNIGLVHMKTGRSDKAKEELDRSLRLYKRTGDQGGGKRGFLDY